MSALIPFYRNLNKQQEGYTLLLDKRTRQVYKVEHRSINQYKYWIMFALTLALLRGLKDISVSMYDLISILKVIILLGISALIGMFKYRRIYKDKREVY